MTSRRRGAREGGVAAADALPEDGVIGPRGQQPVDVVGVPRCRLGFQQTLDGGRLGVGTGRGDEGGDPGDEHAALDVFHHHHIEAGETPVGSG